MARLSITQAAVHLALSPDTIRRRIRKGELKGQRDNKGQWFVDVPDEAAQANSIGSISNAADSAPALPYAPMQPSAEVHMHVAHAAMMDALRSQAADLAARLDRAEAAALAERTAARADLTAAAAERDRLLTMIAELTTRPAHPMAEISRSLAAWARRVLAAAKGTPQGD